MKINCEIAQDLLPLYVDKLTSSESNRLVTNHLKECESCNQVYSAMIEEIPVVAHNEEEPSENTGKQLIRRIKKRKIVSVSSLIIIFTVFGFTLGAIVFYSNNAVIKRVEPIPITIENRNVEANPAEKIQLKSSILKSYKVDNKNFKPGYYDITAIKGNVDMGTIQLSEGEQYLGTPYFSNNVISVKGNGVVQFTPAKFKAETLKNGTYSLQNKSVIYQAGVEIEPGTYKLKVTNNSNTPFYVFVNINNYAENSVDAKSFDIRKSDTYTFSIKNGEIIKILNWSKDKTDLTVKMELVK